MPAVVAVVVIGGKGEFVVVSFTSDVKSMLLHPPLVGIALLSEPATVVVGVDAQYELTELSPLEGPSDEAAEVEKEESVA